MQKVKPKKYLGQHFLTDKNIADKIAGALTANMCNTVIEVGPGMGVLTGGLKRKHENFFAVEIDNESIQYLKSNYTDHSFIIEGDFLKTDLTPFSPPIAVIGNFPYNISSQIFFKILDNSSTVNEVVCMIQKEVAERITSPPGNKTYGILSVLLQAYYNIDYLFTVHEHCFSPAPKVKSSVIRLTRNSRTNLNCNEKLFRTIIKQSFNQRRKTIRNSLKNICVNLEMPEDYLSKRPEQLSAEDFILLTNQIEPGLRNP